MIKHKSVAIAVGTTSEKVKEPGGSLTLSAGNGNIGGSLSLFSGIGVNNNKMGENSGGILSLIGQSDAQLSSANLVKEKTVMRLLLIKMLKQ